MATEDVAPFVVAGKIVPPLPSPSCGTGKIGCTSQHVLALSAASVGILSISSGRITSVIPVYWVDCT